jgi:hypothetical protein
VNNNHYSSTYALLSFPQSFFAELSPSLRYTTFFFLRVLPTGLSGLRIARTNENEALRNGGFFRLFSWNSDYQKCMRGGKSLLTARRSSLKGSASSFAGPKGKRRCDTVFCLMVQCETRRAYIGLYILPLGFIFEMCCLKETKTRFFDDESRGLNVPRQARSNVIRRLAYTYAFRRSLLHMLALRDKGSRFSDLCTDVLLEHVNSEKLLCRTLSRDFSFNDHRGTV